MPSSSSSRSKNRSRPLLPPSAPTLLPTHRDAPAPPPSRICPCKVHPKTWQSPRRAACPPRHTRGTCPRHPFKPRTPVRGTGLLLQGERGNIWPDAAQQHGTNRSYSANGPSWGAKEPQGASSSEEQMPKVLTGSKQTTHTPPKKKPRHRPRVLRAPITASEVQTGSRQTSWALHPKTQAVPKTSRVPKACSGDGDKLLGPCSAPEEDDGSGGVGTGPRWCSGGGRGR